MEFGEAAARRSFFFRLHLRVRPENILSVGGGLIVVCMFLAASAFEDGRTRLATKPAPNGFRDRRKATDAAPPKMHGEPSYKAAQ